MRQLFVRAPLSASLPDFAEHLAKLIQSAPWEERESASYPDGHYFRQHWGRLEVVAQIADDTEHPDADFLVWARQDEGSAAPLDMLARGLVQSGYVLIG